MSLIHEFGEKITLYDKDGAQNKQIKAVLQEPRFCFDACLLIAQKDDVTGGIVVKREKTNEYFILDEQLPSPKKSSISAFRMTRSYPADGFLFLKK